MMLAGGLAYGVAFDFVIPATARRQRRSL